MRKVIFAVVHCASVYVLGGAATSCDCYSTNSSGAGQSPTFTNYTFVDFRSISTNGQDFVDEPPLVGNDQTDGSGAISDSYLNTTAFTDVFALQNWTTSVSEATDGATVDLVNSPQNVYIAQDDAGAPTYLRLRAARMANFSSTAEVDSSFTVSGASFRARARVSGASGAVAGIFFYRNDADESDVEVLTRDPPSQFRASNQPDVDASGNDVPGASTVVNPPDDNGTAFTWEDWVDYRLDWLPAQSDWYVDGVMVASKTYGVPRAQCAFVLNMWSNGGSWSGNMSAGDEAYLDVEWAEIVYNVTAGGDGVTCASVCSVDQETDPGMPPQTSTATRTTLRGSQSAAAVCVTLGMVMIAWILL